MNVALTDYKRYPFSSKDISSVLQEILFKKEELLIPYAAMLYYNAAKLNVSKWLL